MYEQSAKRGDADASPNAVSILKVTRPTAQAAMRGANAAVVGIFGAALYTPVWTSAVLGPRDFVPALSKAR